jgi:hypothetical protein
MGSVLFWIVAFVLSFAALTAAEETGRRIAQASGRRTTSRARSLTVIGAGLLAGLSVLAALWEFAHPW